MVIYAFKMDFLNERNNSGVAETFALLMNTDMDVADVAWR